MAEPLRAVRARVVSCARILGFAALAMAAVCGAAAAQRQEAIVMKLSTATLNDAQHEWMKRFAAAVEKNSSGRIRAEVYPASQLGSIPRQIEGTQLGSIQAWIGPPEFLVGVDPRFELLSVPGLFQNDQHAIRTISDPAFAKAFLALGANKGLVGASLFITGPAVFDMRDADAKPRRPQGQEGAGARLAVPDRAGRQARRHRRSALARRRPAGAAAGHARRRARRTAGVQRAAIPGHGEIHHRNRPRLRLQRGHAEQALVRRPAGRPPGHRDGERRSGPRGGHSVVARFPGAAAQDMGRKGRRGDRAAGGGTRRADAEDGAGRRRHRQGQARAQAAVGPARRQRPNATM